MNFENLVRVIAQTQYMENYGTPDRPHWKCKGGSEYVLKVIDQETRRLLDDEGRKYIYAKDMLYRSGLEDHLINNDMAYEYVLDVCVIVGLTYDEELSIEFDGKIMYPPMHIDSLKNNGHSIYGAYCYL